MTGRNSRVPLDASFDTNQNTTVRDIRLWDCKTGMKYVR